MRIHKFYKTRIIALLTLLMAFSGNNLFCNVTIIVTKNKTLSDELSYFRGFQPAFSWNSDLDQSQSSGKIIETPGFTRKSKTSISDDGLLQISFQFPEMADPGQLINFEVTVKSSAKYLLAAKFQFNWPAGFEPQSFDNQNVTSKIDKNSIVFEWNSSPVSNTINFSYPVLVKNVPSGVYPIISVLKVTDGIWIEKNAKIIINNPQAKNIPDYTNKTTSGIYNVSLDYPRDVKFGSQFDLTIQIAKENSIRPGRLDVTLPPSSEVKVLNHENFEYDQQKGKLSFIWERLPESSIIMINCQVKCNNMIKAVYPINAQFFIEENLKAVFSNNIYLSDNPIVLPQKHVEAVKVVPETVSDTLKLFAEMDSLLNQWKNATKVVTIETGKLNPLPVTNKTEESQKIQSEINKKPEPEIAKKPVQEISINAEPKNEPARQEIKTRIAGTTPVSTSVENVQNGQTQQELTDQKESLPGTVKVYRIQIAASKTSVPDLRQFVQSLGFFETFTEDYDGIWYRYFIGEFTQLAETKDYNKKLMEKGIIDSFVVTFIDGKRITSN